MNKGWINFRRKTSKEPAPPIPPPPDTTLEEEVLTLSSSSNFKKILNWQLVHWSGLHYLNSGRQHINNQYHHYHYQHQYKYHHHHHPNQTLKRSQMTIGQECTTPSTVADSGPDESSEQVLLITVTIIIITVIIVVKIILLWWKLWCLRTVVNSKLTQELQEFYSVANIVSSCFIFVLILSDCCDTVVLGYGPKSCWAGQL